MNTAIAKPWLSLQCQMIPGVRHAVFAAGPSGDGRFATLESWPEQVTAPAIVMTTLQASLASAGVEVRRVASQHSGDDADAWVVACPLRRGDDVCGAVAAHVEGIDESQLPVVTRLMQWGSAWPALFAEQQMASREQGSQPALGVIAAALAPGTIAAVTAATATEIIRHIDADRVAIGLLERGSMQVVALSGRAVFDRRSDRVRAVEAAMDEALEQDTTVAWPSMDESTVVVTVAHERQAGNERCVVTVLLRAAGEVIGALNFIRDRARPFVPADIDCSETLAAALGPALDARRAAARGLIARARHGFGLFAAKLFGDGHTKLKALTAGVAALLLFLVFATGTHEVSATAVLEGAIERDLFAPTDGFVAAAHVRAGARVNAGDVLVTLDDKRLQLERGRLQAQGEELKNEYHRALGDLDRSATRVLGAQIRQAESQLALVQNQLDRVTIIAPFDGIVVSGDLSHALGSPVTRGDHLFRLAPLTGYRVVLEVDEADVPVIESGAVGRLVLAALPGARFDLRVQRMNGMANSKDGRNVLEVEAELIGDGERLRPGMRGVARIEAGRARLLWIWTHRLTERVRMWWWAHSPVA